MSLKFIEWVSDLQCGVDLMGDSYTVPA